MTQGKHLSIAEMTGRCQADIAWIREGAGVSQDLHGAKAAGLLHAVSFAAVPDAFAVSAPLVTRIAVDDVSAGELSLLRSEWEVLHERANRAACIVRSSSTVEGHNEFAFSGMFDSVAGVTTFDELIAAIRSVHASGSSLRAARYARLRGRNIPRDHMAVVVQRYVKGSHSALAELMPSGQVKLEVFHGGLTAGARGWRRPDYSSLHDDLGVSPLPRDLRRRCRVLLSKARTLAQVRAMSPVLLELIFSKNDVQVIQLGHVAAAVPESRAGLSIHLDPSGTPLARRSRAVGLKAAAMEYFKENGLFDLPLLVYEPGASADVIESALRDEMAGTDALTARFSCGVELSLPRLFTREMGSLVDWIARSRRSEWACVVHPYIRVRRSFECVVSEHSFLLEHVPGMWESDNDLQPDVLRVDGRVARAHLVKGLRNARLTAVDHRNDVPAPPVRLEAMQVWASRLDMIASDLRRDFGPSLPLNFHFVEDDLERWFFLNVRRGIPSPPSSEAVTQPMHEVCRPTDLDGWDGCSPIRLRLSVTRGDEEQLLRLAARLPAVPGFKVYVDFGVLSHPAMILRELGFDVRPSYEDCSMREQTYSNATWELEQPVDPVSRIRAERPVFEDECVRIVADRSAIVPGHLLMLSQKQAPSFADCDDVGSVADVVAKWTSNEQPHILVERGRATFCTTGFTTVHAHGHLLPVSHVGTDAVDRFAAELGAEPSDSLASALELLKSKTGEYIIIAGSAKTFVKCLAPGETFGKRRIRQFFARRVGYGR